MLQHTAKVTIRLQLHLETSGPHVLDRSKVRHAKGKLLRLKTGADVVSIIFDDCV